MGQRSSYPVELPSALAFPQARAEPLTAAAVNKAGEHFSRARPQGPSASARPRRSQGPLKTGSRPGHCVLGKDQGLRSGAKGTEDKETWGQASPEAHRTAVLSAASPALSTPRSQQGVGPGRELGLQVLETRVRVASVGLRFLFLPFTYQ